MLVEGVHETLVRTRAPAEEVANALLEEDGARLPDAGNDFAKR